MFYVHNFTTDIFISQPNLAMESGFIFTSKLPPSGCLCKIQFVYVVSTISQKKCFFYKKGDAELIRRAINEFNWIRYLSNVNVDEKVCYFTKTLPNIVHHFIPHERIVGDEKDPSWINNWIKKLINEKNYAYKSYCRFSRDVFLFEKLWKTN